MWMTAKICQTFGGNIMSTFSLTSWIAVGKYQVLKLIFLNNESDYMNN